MAMSCALAVFPAYSCPAVKIARTEGTQRLGWRIGKVFLTLGNKRQGTGNCRFILPALGLIGGLQLTRPM